MLHEEGMNDEQEMHNGENITDSGHKKKKKREILDVTDESKHMEENGG